MTQSKKGKTGIDEQLRQAILDSGLTAYAVAKGSGVGQPVLSRFLARERDIRLATELVRL